MKIALMPESATRLLTYNATVVQREDLTDKLAIFRIRPDAPFCAVAPDGLAPRFRPGQYVVLGANNEEAPELGSVRRAYSMCSPPSEDRWLEFYIRYVDRPTSRNPLTHLLWKRREGDRLHLGDRITGRFTMADTVGEDDPRVKLFVAAGTGLAPFVSMVLNYATQNGPHRKWLERCILLHGVSHPVDLGYRADLERILNDASRRYLPTISRSNEHPDWPGAAGRVESFFDNGNLERLEAQLGFAPGFVAPGNCVVFICGLQDMIAQTLIRLLRRGFVPDDKRLRRALRLPDDAAASLFFEQYDSAPILDLKNEGFLATLRSTFPGGLPA